MRILFTYRCSDVIHRRSRVDWVLRQNQRIIRLMLGSNSFRSARATLAGIELWRMLKKDQGKSALPAWEQFYLLRATGSMCPASLVHRVLLGFTTEPFFLPIPQLLNLTQRPDQFLEGRPWLLLPCRIRQVSFYGVSRGIDLCRQQRSHAFVRQHLL